MQARAFTSRFCWNSIGETSHDQFLDGLVIENTNITVKSADAMTILPTLFCMETRQLKFLVEGSSGILIADLRSQQKEEFIVEME